MSFTRSDDGDATTVHMSGKLEVDTVQEFRALSDVLIAEGRRHFTLDMSGLDAIDSSGVAAVVSLYKHAREAGGDVRIEGIRDQPLAIFRLLRFDKVFDL
jgi:anti-sigma B factor antagonist